MPRDHSESARVPKTPAATPQVVNQARRCDSVAMSPQLRRRLQDARHDAVPLAFSFFLGENTSPGTSKDVKSHFFGENFWGYFCHNE